MKKLKDEIREKKRQIRVLEQRVIDSVETSPYGSSNLATAQVSLPRKDKNNYNTPMSLQTY